MRLLGRSLFAALLLILVGIAVLLARSALARVDWTAATGERDFAQMQPSLVYALRVRPTTFVLSRPQRRVRLLTNVAAAGSRAPDYALVVEALNEDGEPVWRQSLHLRSVRLLVRNRRGVLIPQTVLAGDVEQATSAGDATLIDFDAPVSVLRLTAGESAGVNRIFVRVQEQRPISQRQLQVGWQRLSAAERQQLAAGNPLGPELLSDAERRRLLIELWHPVGPAGVRGDDYVQTQLYERVGPVIAPAEGA